jgi:predicted HTH transcriptional regulator
MEKDKIIPEVLLEALYHGTEEPYLEYKGDVSWGDKAKKLEVVQTIFALSNERGGGIIIIGVADNGDRVGLTEENYGSYKHDTINQYLDGRGNQPVKCKVSKFVHKTEEEEGDDINLVFIQVSETKEFPLVYIGPQEIRSDDGPKDKKSNIGLRNGALYIRNKLNVGNKEIITQDEWQELIERSIKKFEKESIRRYSMVKDKAENPFDKELKI